MCGIFCAYNYQTNSIFNKYKFIEATEMVLHRGPDACGFFEDADCFLGHTRLAITDLHSAADQPFIFENLVLIFNGEIFNFIQLKTILSDMGYVFSTSSDTEVVIKAFHGWGVKCFEKFNGMWSIIIYDKSTKKLIVSRDRFGQKPLFYTRVKECLIFSSEIQQLIRFSGTEINYKIVQSFLKEGGYDDHGQTFFKSITVFPIASYAEIDAGNILFSEYWDYWSGDVTETTNDCYENFHKILENAVKIRLPEDVDAGILLSGGIDSTLIASHIAESGNYTKISYPSYTYSSLDSEDESNYAAIVAKNLAFPIFFAYQDLDAKSYIDRLRSIVKHLGQGNPSPATVSVDYLYEIASNQGIKVMFDGQGADELLAGYEFYYIHMLVLYLSKFQFKQICLLILTMFKNRTFLSIVVSLRSVLPEKLKKIGRYLYGYESLFKTYKDSNNSRVYVPKKRRIKNYLNRLLINQHRIGLSKLLYYGDITSMRHSIENRSPFLDHRLVEFSFARDEGLKIYNGVKKYVLKYSPYYKIFEKILDRKKIGFSSNLSDNIKREMVKQLQEFLILDLPIFSKKIKTIVRTEKILKLKYERMLFRLFQVHLWHQIFIENKSWSQENLDRCGDLGQNSGKIRELSGVS